MSASKPLMTICAYLCRRDNDPANPGDSFAGESLDQLHQVKDTFEDAVRIFVAWDDPKNNETWFKELEKCGGDREKPVTSPDRSIVTVITEFLQWVNDDSPKGVPRVLLYSGHGTPGVGLGRLGLPRSKLWDFATRTEMQPLLEAFASQRLLKRKKEEKEDREVSLAIPYEDLVLLLPKGPEFEILLSEGRKTFVDVLSLLVRTREQPEYLQLGLNLMACGVQESDMLSVRRFRRCLEKFQPSCQFDVILLQACSIGQIEVAYELRNVCKSLILNTTPFEGHVHLQEGLSATLTMLATSRKRGKPSFELIASHQLIQKQIDARLYSNQPGVGFIASMPSEPDLEILWGDVNRLCSDVFEVLNQAFADDPVSARTRLRRIRSSFPRGEYSCEKEIYDLNEFVCAVVAEFRVECGTRIDAYFVKNLMLGHNSLIGYSSATQFLKFACSADGLSLYFPLTKIRLYDSYNYDDAHAPDAPENQDGFEWLKGNGWRKVLENYFA